MASLVGAGVALSLIPADVDAADVFIDAFNGDSSALYGVFEFVPGRDGAEFGYDYGAVGIPEAPNSPGGVDSQRGLRMFANNPSGGTTGATGAVQVVPTGIDAAILSQPFTLAYDLWMNVNGPLPGGGAGSTEAFMAGVGWTGSAPIEVGNTNGSYFTITGEGGSGTDVRSFTNDGFNAAGINQGPSNNSSDPFYSGIFPGGIDVGALPIQGGTDNQTGTTVAGQMAFMWHEVRIDVLGNDIKFYVDDLLIAHDVDGDRDGNVMVGYADYFSSETDAPQWSFGLVDNLRVTVIPEPGAGLLGLLGLGLVALRRRR